MRTTVCAAVLLTMLLIGCAEMTTESTPPTGKLVMAGPVSTEGLVPLMRWQYGVQTSLNPKQIGEIRFSCEQIPGATFSAKQESLKLLSNGTLVVEGPALPVSPETTGWLFERYSTTAATCRAAVVRAGQADFVMQAPVSFTPQVKEATLAQFKLDRPEPHGHSGAKRK